MNDALLADYAAVRHILASPSIAARTARYVGPGDFDWNGLLSEAKTMSTGEGVLVRIAHDLWEARGVVSVWELARRLDGRTFARVVEAIYICRGELGPGTEALHAAV
jgi:hypothetical protein